MRSVGSWTRQRLVRLLAVGLCALGTACAKDGPTIPSPVSGSYVGTWSGAIVSAAIGEGSLVLVLTSQLGPPNTPLVNGHWTSTFVDSRFSTSGKVVASIAPDGTVGVVFDRNTVPCPQEASGAAQQTMFASMTVTGQRMTGSYIAGICPGGTMELMKQ